MSPLQAQPSPELGLDLVRDAVDVRRLPRWDPRYWGHIALENEARCSARFRARGMSWAAAHAQARALSRRTKLTAESLANERDSERQLAHHKFRLEPKDAITREGKRAVTPLVAVK